MRLAAFQRMSFARVGAASAAASDATYIVQTPSSSLPNAQALSALSSGLLYNTTTTGVLQAATLGAGLAGTTSITNTFATGLATGQILYGGVAAGEGLDIQSTSHANKGPVRVYATQILFTDNVHASGLISVTTNDVFALYGTVGEATQIGSNGVANRINVATTGAVTIADLAGATATLVKISTTGLMSRAASGTDYQVPLTFGSGLSGTTTITNDVLTGVAGGGQVWSSGTGTGEAGFIQSTTHSVKGPITFRVSQITLTDNVHATGRLDVGTTNDVFAIYGTTGETLTLGAGNVTNRITLGINSAVVFAVGGVDPGSTATSYVDVNPNSTPSAGGVTIANLFTARFRAQTFANSGSSNTISGEAATVYIDGPPVFSGTWATGYSNTSLRVAAGITYLGGDLRVWDGSAAMVINASTVSQSLDVGVKTFSLALQNTTIASAAGATYNGIIFPQGGATVVTITGTTTIATAGGFNVMDIGVVSYTDASAVTITHAATVRIAGAPAAAGSVTITNPYALWIDSGLLRYDGQIAAGGGAAPTFTTIGGSGPGTAAQSGWIKLNIDGNARFIPVWA